MNKLSSFLLGAACTLCLAAANLTAAKPNPNPPPPAPVLGSAATFAVLAGTTVTNVGNTVINGDLGVSPGTSITGFPPGVVNGTQHITDTIAAQAQLDLTTAFNFAAGLPGVAPITDLANSPATALHPGLYYSTTTNMIIGTGGILYLQGKGVYIFQMGKGGSGGTSLTVSDTASMVLTGGADAADIYWVVGTAATFGTGTAWAGTIMAGAQITHAGGDTLNGRALSTTEVTFDGVGSTVTRPAISAGKGPKK